MGFAMFFAYQLLIRSDDTYSCVLSQCDMVSWDIRIHFSWNVSWSHHDSLSAKELAGQRTEGFFVKVRFVSMF